MIPAPRIHTLDTVRGVAVMGILLLNIVSFGLPEAAYMNPRAYGGWHGVDLGVYLFNFVVFDGKMRGLFSFLFGASMLLVIEGAEVKGESGARTHYARMVWLLVFGLLHLWLVWMGDILSHYALVGMLAYFFRDKPVARLVRIGVILLVVQLLLMAMLPLLVVHAQQGLANPDPVKAKQAAETLAGFTEGFGVPSAQFLTEQIAQYRSGYASLVLDRFATTRFFPLLMVFQVGAETLAYMLFGMAAYRSGLLLGAWERRRMLRTMAIAFGIGIPAYVAIVGYMAAQGFSTLAVCLGALVLTTPFRPLVILGWACLIVLLARPGGALTTRIAATGRMAFTNYLMTSILCTTLFYGYGFGLFATLSRAQIYLVVLAMWALMLLWSQPWLARFRFGPFEWLWRSLARGSVQPMRGAANDSPKIAANASQ
jgi:uncharacterized protein